jgi:pimeloyl-ACP methyl ester carboxylesterase
MRVFLSATCFFCFALNAATVDGVAIHSTVTGAGPATIILVHGWTCDETTWTEQTPALAARFRVVTVDLPGHGKSGSPKDGKLSIDLFARAVEAVRAEAGADRVILAGHSMGTPVVIQYAKLYPRHTAALVFVDGLVTMGNRRAPDRRQWMGEEGRANRERMIRGMFSGATTPELQTKILDMMLAAPAATAAGAMDAMFEPAAWRDATLNMPILGLYAEKSSLHNPAYMKEHFPKLEYHEIAGSGHFLMLEKPEEFNRLLLEFLERVE